jgi:hypothetical protein
MSLAQKENTSIGSGSLQGTGSKSSFAFFQLFLMTLAQRAVTSLQLKIGCSRAELALIADAVKAMKMKDKNSGEAIAKISENCVRLMAENEKLKQPTSESGFVFFIVLAVCAIGGVTGVAIEATYNGLRAHFHKEAPIAPAPEQVGAEMRKI